MSEEYADSTVTQVQVFVAGACPENVSAEDLLDVADTALFADPELSDAAPSESAQWIYDADAIEIQVREAVNDAAKLKIEGGMGGGASLAAACARHRYFFLRVGPGHMASAMSAL